MSPDIPYRWVTSAARKSLSRRFALADDPFSQDWEWEVADPSRLDEFLNAYESGDLDEDERFALMEILIQCIEDMDLPSVESSPQWLSVANLLRINAGLHASSVRYWSVLDDRAGETAEKRSEPPFFRLAIGECDRHHAKFAS